MPRYYQFGGRPHMYEADWQGWPLPAVKAAPGSTLSSDDIYGSLGDGGVVSPGAASPLPLGVDFMEVVGSAPVRAGSAAAMAYHGYKRTRSNTWAVLWALFGSAMPLLAVPLSLAQGFGKPKMRSNPKKRKRLSTLRAYKRPTKKKKRKKRRGRRK